VNYAPWVIALRAGEPTDRTVNGASPHRARRCDWRSRQAGRDPMHLAGRCWRDFRRRASRRRRPDDRRPCDGRLGYPSGGGGIASAGAAARRYARMFHARILSFAVAPPARPARRPAAAGKPAAGRRLRHWLGLRRRARW